MSVLDNLYSNAVHYGAESGNICLRSSLHGARVYIDVINTGTPIPQEERAIIFEPFFQGSHQRKGAVKGSGLDRIAGIVFAVCKGNCIWSTRAGKTFVSALNYRRQKTRNNANSLSYQAILFVTTGSARNLRHVRYVRSGFSALSMSRLSATITPTGIGFKSGEYATHFSTITAPTAVAGRAAMSGIAGLRAESQ